MASPLHLSKLMIRNALAIQDNIATKLLIYKRVVNDHYFFIWITPDTIGTIGKDKESWSHQWIDVCCQEFIVNSILLSAPRDILFEHLVRKRNLTLTSPETTH